ncbi:unnamed protein product [Boreogadus saida]
MVACTVQPGHQAATSGLAPPWLGQHVRLAGPPNLEVALDVAERAERELPDLQSSGASRPHVRRADYEQDDDGEECFQAWTSPQRPRQRPPKCPPPDDRRESGTNRRCFRCGEPGHLARDWHRHHGLDHLVRRETTAEWPSEGTTAPDSNPSPWSVRSGAVGRARGLYLRCRIDGRPCTALVDTGSTISLVRPGIFPGTTGALSGGVDGDKRPPDDRDGTGERNEGEEAAGRPGG